MSEQRRFAEAEVDAILRLAIARQGKGEGLSRAELADVVSQLGVDPEDLDDAINEHDSALLVQTEIAEWKARRRPKLIAHAGAFAVVTTLFVVASLLTAASDMWAMWPLLVWGAALGAQALAWLNGPDPDELQSGRLLRAERADRARRRAEKAAQRERKRANDEAFKRASEELGNAVKAGVTGLIENLGKSLRDAAPQSLKRSEEPTRVRVGDTNQESASEAEVELELEALRRLRARGGR